MSPWTQRNVSDVRLVRCVKHKNYGVVLVRTAGGMFNLGLYLETYTSLKIVYKELVHLLLFILSQILF